MTPSLPQRFEPVAAMGEGGGGAVYCVRDRVTGERLALKLLREGASPEEHEALVREAVALSGLEGLGAPRVLRFGRLAAGRRAYLVRELVEGVSLASLLSTPEGALRGLDAMVAVADELTLLHRAGLLHGDVKPANVIVREAGRSERSRTIAAGTSRVALVDLGLASVLGEHAGPARGLTLGYAAPELLEGAPLGVRQEIHALGVTLREVFVAARARLDPSRADAIERIAARATAREPSQRHPSTDELASELGRALGLSASTDDRRRIPWAVLGMDHVARTLLDRVESMPSGGGVIVLGPAGSGRSSVLRRLAWSLGVAGTDTIVLEGYARSEVARALDLELADVADVRRLVVLVDDVDGLPVETAARIAELRERGGRLVVTGGAGDAPSLGATLGSYELPELPVTVAEQLVVRASPALGAAVVSRILERSGRRPGPLRRLVASLADAPVVAPDDVDRLVPHDDPIRSTTGVPGSTRAPSDLAHARSLLERGRFDEAESVLARLRGETGPELAVLRARLGSNRGAWREAIVELRSVEGELATAPDAARAGFGLELARAHLRGGDYAACFDAARAVVEEFGAFVDVPERPLPSRDVAVCAVEAAAVGGLARSFLGQHAEARPMLDRAVVAARRLGEPRTLSVALGSLAPALQRVGELDAAAQAYEEALAAAERAGDAGSVATTRLNLAAVAKARGDLGGAVEHLEAAVDMGRRSGRKPTLRQALLNLANLELYLGRLARARSSIDALARERDELAPHQAPQLVALEAEAAQKAGDFETADVLCARCADDYEALGRPVDAAEARLEGLLAHLDAIEAERVAFAVDSLALRVAVALRLLGDGTAHRAALELARGRIARLDGRQDEALASFDRAIAYAEQTGKRDWLVRALQARAALHDGRGDLVTAQADRGAALAVLQAIAAKLPSDLAEVFWNEPSRRVLRPIAPTSHSARGATAHAAEAPRSSRPSPTLMRVTQDRLARVLEINRELAGTYDLERLLERVTDHAVALASAERGFVLLRAPSSAVTAAEAPELHVHGWRASEGDVHARFSRSIAERVLDRGEPIVTTSARDDDRMSEFVSVHQLMLQSVACVPIRARSGAVLGALYLETRLRPERRFEDELPLLVALADQVAIAIATATLVRENARRAEELARANGELEAARKELESLLGQRTEQLAETRRDLKAARSVLTSHFGYEGLVGTSEAMRRVYAMIDRIKDADVAVLLTGESGTGKEVVARAIHGASPRKKSPFVGLNCGSIPEHLLESELFGHARGAFTGADRDRKGLFREASGGAILLDEIGEMPTKMQAGLLRVLQEKVVRPVGAAREEPVDCRVIAATHRDLEAMVARGSFREDLYYRLNVIQVRVPALRERIEDVPMLIDHFLTLFAARYGRERRSVSRAALRILMAHRWPGNVRQLENVLLNAWVLSDGPELVPEDFELGDTGAAALARPVAAQPASAARSEPPRAETSLDAHRASERDRILAALTACNWNRLKAAERVGMPRRTFYRRLKEYGIQ